MYISNNTILDAASNTIPSELVIILNNDGFICNFRTFYTNRENKTVHRSKRANCALAWPKVRKKRNEETRENHSFWNI